MSGKKLFFISLIVLSVFMGKAWFKNRPKEKKVRPKKTVQVPVDLENTGQETSPEGDPEGTTEEPSEEAMASDTVPTPEELEASATTDVVASEPGEIATATVAVASEPVEVKLTDPVLLAFDELGSSTFDPSPFSRMMAEAGKVTDESGEVKSNVKTTQLLQAPFGGLIEIDQELQAIIGHQIYKAGSDYEGKTIKKVEWDLITLEDPNGLYLIPKKGVEISLASDGTYNILGDTYKKY